jgi:hypothetical protein
MAERIKQILIVYLSHRWIKWVAALFFLCMFAPNVLLLSRRSAITADSAVQLTMLLGFPLMFVTPYLVANAKAQFAHPRARLMPEFAEAHIAVLVTLLAILLVGYPALIAICCHARPTGLVGLALAMGAPAVWAVHHLRPSWFLPTLLVYFSSYTEAGIRWWIADADANFPFHAIIIGVGVVLLAVWLRRLCELREESDDYQNNVSWHFELSSGRGAIEHRRIVANQVGRSPLLTSLVDGWLKRLPAPGRIPTKHELVQLLRYGFGAWPAEVGSLFGCAIMAAVTLFMAKFTQFGSELTTSSLNVMIFFAIFMPGFSGGESIAQRRSRLATELLRPGARTDYVDALFMAAAWNTVVSWLILNIGLLAVAWHVLGKDFTPHLVATYLLLATTASVATWGLSLRVAVWPSRFKRLFVSMLPWSLAGSAGGAIMAHGVEIRWLYAVPIAVAFAAAGAWLMVSARRAWLNLELG